MKILFLYIGESYKLPPFLTLLDCLGKENELTVACYETKENLNKLKEKYAGLNMTFINVLERKKDAPTIYNRIKKRINRYIEFPSKYADLVNGVIKETQYDKLWIIHERTLYALRDKLNGLSYSFSMYELMDAYPKFLQKIKLALKGADNVIVAEENRAQILRVWMELDKTPIVIPNKPLKHPRTKNIPLKNEVLGTSDKVILYQGHVQKNRNIDAFCKAMPQLKGFKLVVMGGWSEYRDELQKKYPYVKFIDFVNPPEHLYITSHAYIGIVKYDYVDLNQIFCAPNKTYEYSGFGTPMISNEIPGLVNTVGRFKAACCIDTDDVQSIVKAVKTIDENYDEYSKNATAFYEATDIEQIINNVAKHL